MSVVFRGSQMSETAEAKEGERPVINTPFQSEDPIEAFREKAVVLPHHIYWRFALAISVCLTVLLVIFQVVFAKGQSKTPRYLLDVFYAIDWFLHLLLTFHPKKRTLVYRERSIHAMFVDFLSLIPLEIIVNEYRCELNRLLRIYRPLVYFHEGRRNVQRHPILMVFLEYIVLILMMSCLGGALLDVTSCDVYDSPSCQTYVEKALEHMNFNDTINHPWPRYIFTQLVMAREMTQRGFLLGEQRKSVPNKVASTLMMLIHLFVFLGLVFPAMVIAIAQRRHTRFTLAENYPFHKASLQLRNCSHMMNDIIEYYRMQWEGHRGVVEEIEDMKPLTSCMQDQVRMDAHWNLLRHAQVFSGTDISSRKKLARTVQSWHLPPGYEVFMLGKTHNRLVYIVLGTVEVLNKEEKLVAHLGPGSVLGTTNLFHNIPSPFTVRCASYCVFDYIERDKFQQLADEYPALRVQVDWDFQQRLKLSRETITAIERLTERYPREMSERKRPSEWMNDMFNLLIPKEEYKPTPHNERPIWEAAYNLKYLEEYGFAMPSIAWTPSACCGNKMFHPGSIFLDTWNKVSGGLIIANAIAVPYYCVTVPRLHWDFIIYFLVSMAMNLADFGLLMVTAVRTPDGLVMHPRKILSFQLRNWLFWLDCITVLSMFLLFIDRTLLNPFIALCGLLNVGRLHHIFRRSEASRMVSLTYVNGWTVTMFLLLILYPIYFWAVVFYGDTCSKYKCGVQGWITTVSAKDVHPLALSFLHIATMTICMPYHEISLTDSSDILFMIGAKITLYMFTIFVTSYLTSFIEIQRIHRVEYMSNRFHMIRVMAHRKVHPDTQEKVLYCLSTIGTVCDYRLNVYTGKILYYLPQYLDLYKTNYDIISFLESIPLFENTRKDFIRALAKKIRVHVLPPYTVLVEEGKYASDLFILEDGLCENVVKPGNPKVFHKSKNVFPLAELLGWYPALRSIKTLTNCRIFTIDFFKFKRLLAKYKDIEQHFDRAVREVFDEDTVQELEQHRKEAALLKPTIVEELPEMQKSFHEQKSVPRKMSSLWFYYIKHLFLFYQILPHGKFLIYWEILRIIFAVLTCFLFPLRRILGYYYSISYIGGFMLLDLTAYLDIYLRFRHAYHDQEGWVVVGRGKCAFHYLTHGFFTDVFACFPFDVFFGFYMRPARVSMLGSILYNNRVVQIYRIRQIESILNHFHMEINHLWVISAAAVVGMIAVHAISAFHATLICELQDDMMLCPSRTGDPPDFSGASNQPLEMYLWILCYFFSNCMGIAFADEKREIGFPQTAFLSLFGHCMRIIVCSYAIALYVEHNMGFLAYKQSLKQLIRFMTHGKVTERLKNAVIDYNEMYWLRTQNVDSAGLFNILHPHLCSMVLLEMFQESLKQCRVLSELGDDAVRIVMPVARLIIYSRRCRLCRVNDIMDCVLVVVNGSVLVEGPDRNPMGVFGNGVMFGNLDSGSCNRVNISVIAVDHQVEVLRFRTERLFERLRRFPMFDEVMQFYLRLRVDYVPPVERHLKVASSVSFSELDSDVDQGPDALKPEGEGDRDEILLRRERNDVGLDRLRNCARWMKWACGFTVLHPYDYYPIIIWTLLLTAAVFAYILVMFQMGASELYIGDLVFVYFLDLVHGAAIFFTFRCGYFDTYGRLIMDKELIKRRYIKSLVFYTDVISVIPADIIPLGMGEYLVASFVRLNRILRLFKVFQHLKVHTCSLQSTVWIRRIGYIILFALRTVLSLGSVLAFLRKIHEASPPETVERRVISYFNGTHSVLMMLASGALNEVRVRHVDFLVFFLVAGITCKIVWILIVVWCCSYIHAIKKPLEKYVRRCIILENYVKTRSLSKPIYRAASEYLRILWFEWRGLNEPELLSCIPHIMQQALRSSNYGVTVRSYGFYRNLHKDFMRQVLEGVRRCYYYKENDIAQQGIADGCTFFIFSGEVEEIAEGQDFQEEVERILRPGDVFGIVQGVFPDWPHRRTYRARTKVCVLYLHHDSWQRLLSFFPAARDEMFNSANSMYIFTVNK